MQLIALNPDLTPKQKTDLTWGVTGIASLVSPISLEGAVNIAAINAKLKGFTPPMANIAPQTFSNMKCRFRAACEIAGILVQPGKNQGALSVVWKQLLAMVPDDWDRRRLSRFAHYAGQQGWKPEDITTEHMLRFLALLAHHAINGQEWDSYTRTCKTWNKQVKTIPGWPGTVVEIIRKRDPYMVSMDALHPVLRAVLLAYLDILAGGGDPLDGDAPVFLKGITRKSLSPVTIKLRRTQIMQYVSALVAQGYPLDTLASVDAITTTKAITDAMDFFFHRAGDKMATQIQYIALAVRGLLHHHITGRLRHGIRVDKYRPASLSNQFSDPRIDLLDQIIREARPQERGLVAKNKKCNAQFDDPRNLAKLLHLPRRLLKQVAKTGGKDGVRLAEIALAIEFLLMCPIRISNLVGIDLDRHILKSSSGKKAVFRLSIPKGEVKNKHEIEFEFPDHLARMLERHINLYRPQLSGAGSTWLFPSTDGGPRLYKLMTRQISGIIRTHTGLIITSHQFRHLAGKMFLDGHPVGHETVRQVLGHASIDTTTQYYTGNDQVKSGRAYDKAVLALRDSTKFITTKKRTKS
ncbi:hypothetical protein A6A04_19470 [Paramagnetospirillum marisnigri]|uniref:Tyr recombinase domain-containing protein n=1 Tax=Paramagnetospirillum marisnigri TaxID=1285242 RepID=A0A178MMU3_9PROT|nr:hypothetical protein A6A04_19470 [Paramagnetospirillum marisnigri]